MTDLYELTRKLVAHGCPEHPRLRCGTPLGFPGASDTSMWWIDPDSAANSTWCKAFDDGQAQFIDPDDARAIWATWALEWYLGLAALPSQRLGRALALAASCELTDVLEAIESETRHLEPTNEPA